jgi:uncharacterized RDD family membrane protein YckC
LGLFLFQKPLFALERKGFWRSLWMSLASYRRYKPFLFPMSVLIGLLNGLEALVIPTYNYFLRIPLSLVEAAVTLVTSVAIVEYFQKHFIREHLRNIDEKKSLPTNVVYRRIGAWMIDLLLLAGIYQFLAYHLGTHGVIDKLGTYSEIYSLAGFTLSLYAVFVFGYFVILEWRWQGTVGKRLVGIRVTTLDGRQISIGQSLVRNVLRIIDAFPYIIPYLLGLVVIAGSERKQRLGDKAAGTIVVGSK